MNRKRMAAVLRVLAVVVVVLAATSAQAVTDLEKFQKKLGKIAPIKVGGGLPDRPAGLCFCQSGPIANRTGYLVQYRFDNYVRMDCVAPLFDATETASGFLVCSGAWIPLPK